MFEKFPQIAGYAPAELEEIVLFRVTPEVISVLDYRKGFGHTGGFCLVSSDSDFTRLATRIREDGLPVYGFGEEKTPRSFINAYDRFIYTEIFRTKAVGSSKVIASTKSGPLRDFNTANKTDGSPV